MAQGYDKYELDNQTGQSFRSSGSNSQHTSRLGEGGAQIRNLTTQAEARQQAIKDTLLLKQAAQREVEEELKAAAAQQATQDEAPSR